MSEVAEVRIVDVQPRLAAVVRGSVSFADMGQAQRAARRALDALPGGRAAFGPRLTIWRPPEAGLVDYAPGIIVPEPIEPFGDISLFALPAGRAAHLRLRGGYEKLPGAWQRLFGACAAEGIATAGLNWEIYAPEDAGPEEAGADLYALLA